MSPSFACLPVSSLPSRLQRFWPHLCALAPQSPLQSRFWLFEAVSLRVFGRTRSSESPSLIPHQFRPSRTVPVAVELRFFCVRGPFEPLQPSLGLFALFFCCLKPFIIARTRSQSIGVTCTHSKLHQVAFWRVVPRVTLSPLLLPESYSWQCFWLVFGVLALQSTTPGHPSLCSPLWHHSELLESLSNSLREPLGLSGLCLCSIGFPFRASGSSLHH